MTRKKTLKIFLKKLLTQKIIFVRITLAADEKHTAANEYGEVSKRS